MKISALQAAQKAKTPGKPNHDNIGPDRADAIGVARNVAVMAIPILQVCKQRVISWVYSRDRRRCLLSFLQSTGLICRQLSPGLRWQWLRRGCELSRKWPQWLQLTSWSSKTTKQGFLGPDSKMPGGRSALQCMPSKKGKLHQKKYLL